MAKGFKVIPKETPKKEEWDYERIKQRVKEANRFLSSRQRLFLYLSEEFCTVMF